MTAWHATRPGHDIADRLGGILAGPDLAGAACARRGRDGKLIHDPDLWFPHASKSERNNRANSAPARQVCRWCPVIDKCLAWALENDPLDGIWGGKTETQRGVLRRRGKGAA